MKLWSILGNSQKLDGGAMFGNAPKAMWERWSSVDADNRIDLACRALLASPLNGKTVLFETGIGAFFEPKLRERYGVVEDRHVLLESLRAAGTKHFIFSSTCATYGEPQYVPLDEAHPQSPANPYGWSKFMVERILESYAHAYDFKFVALRYFNASGAMQGGSTPSLARGTPSSGRRAAMGITAQYGINICLPENRTSICTRPIGLFALSLFPD